MGFKRGIQLGRYIASTWYNGGSDSPGTDGMHCFRTTYLFMVRSPKRVGHITIDGLVEHNMRDEGGSTRG